jgi:hypothetical protein
MPIEEVEGGMFWTSRRRRQRWMMRAGGLMTRLALPAALLALLALAACGAPGGVGDRGGATATAVGGACGTVTTGPRPLQNTPAARNVEQCFAAAFSQCKPATLSFVAGGIDAVTTHALAVAPSSGGGCHLADARQVTLAGSGTAGSTTTQTCAAATLETDGLRISGCQDGLDFTVAGAAPPSSPTPSPSAAG